MSLYLKNIVKILSNHFELSSIFQLTISTNLLKIEYIGLEEKRLEKIVNHWHAICSSYLSES